MFSTVFSALIVLALALQVASFNVTYDYYCGKELTCGDTPNIMCNRTTRFPADCKDAEYIPINDALMAMFLDGHNKLRNQLALGQTEGIFNDTTIADMATIAWDDELELMSLHNAVQCRTVDDECHRTFNYKTVGQNTHAICEKKRHVSIDAAVNESMNTWFSEYKNVPTLEAIQNYGSTKTDSPIKQFAQLVQSKADRIGCSIVRYIRKGRNGRLRCTIIGCNYSAGTVNGLPIYKTGEPASECQTGKNPIYPGLCSPREEYTKHENAQTYFTNAASPVVPLWVKNNKQIDLGNGQKL